MGQPVESYIPVASTSLQDYFHHSVSRAVDHQRVMAGDATIHYLVNLLTHFSRSENLFDYSDEGIRLRPLAHIYADAVHSESDRERRLMLRRMGDIALFVAGMFSGFFTRRRALVGRDYYIAMGGQAYASLADAHLPGAGGEMVDEVFGQLSNDFGRFVLVLTEVGEEGVRRRRRDLDALVAGWVGSGDARIHGADAHQAMPSDWGLAGVGPQGRH